jgi:hypothetical protein
MKNHILLPLFSSILSLGALSPSGARGQEASPYATAVHYAWGAPTNGVRTGISYATEYGTINYIVCSVHLLNVTTNRSWIWTAPPEKRYEMELRGPDGQRITPRVQLKPTRLGPTFWGPIYPPQDKEKLGMDGTGRINLTEFRLAEKYDLKTNGLHTLIVSVRVNTFSNMFEGKTQMKSKPVYFLTPPVTNTFDVVLDKTHNQLLPPISP